MSDKKSDLNKFNDNNTQSLRPPDWVSDAVFYQIFPERFYNGNPENDPEDTEVWGGKPTRDNFFGGDLQGIIQKLDYLEELGINAIYLNPIFKSPTNHKYNTTDYYEIDPAFGDKSILKSLVNTAHEKNMKVVLDGVFNHCGQNFSQFRDVNKKGNDSNYWDWYEVDGFPIETEPEPNYRCWAGVPYMPEFDRTNTEVRRYLLDIVQYWIEEADIDGWRLDTTNYLEPGFVRSVRTAAKETQPEAYVMGEVVGPASSWFKSGSLDGVMNYELYKYLVDFLAKEDYGAREFRQRIYFLRRSYPEWANFGNYNLLGSHDRPRFMTLCENDPDRFKLAYFFLFTFPGAPAIYYGDEIGMEGGDDPDCRRTYPWNKNKYHGELLDYFKKLVELRKEEKSLKEGSFREIAASNEVFAYARGNSKEQVVGVINSGSGQNQIEISSKALSPVSTSSGEVLFGDAVLNNKKNGLQLKIPGYGYCLLKL